MCLPMFSVNMMQPNIFSVHLFDSFACSTCVVLCDSFSFLNDFMVVVVVVVVFVYR